MPAQKAGAAPRLAAVDVGTNSIRLVVAEVEPDGNYRVLDEEREMTRLGRGLYETGWLGRRPMDRTLDALAKMRAIADGFGVEQFRVVATAAVREATNGHVFRRAAARRAGVPLELISPEEEARLAHLSVRRHFQLGHRSAAIVDIGGGSVEVVLAAGGVIHQVYSLPLGAVRLTEAYHRSDPLRPKHWRKLRQAIDDAIDDVIGKPPLYPEVMVGSGGTFTNIGEMLQCDREGRITQIRGYGFTESDLVHLVDRLRETPLAERRAMCGLNPKRADIITAGATAVARLARRLGTTEILVNDRGIRDGLLVSMIEDLLGPRALAEPQAENRIQWVREFARACRSNERHCDQVASIAVQLFDSLQEPFEIPAHGREILEAAALLHDVGYLIHHAKHHKHAYHLIMHGDLRGFSPGEVELIANVARYHRRALPKKKHPNFRRLDRADRLLVRQLAGILRIADGLDRTHGRNVSQVRAEVTDGGVCVVVEAEQNPSVDIADGLRKSDLFQRVFGAPACIEWSRHGRRSGARQYAAPARRQGRRNMAKRSGS
jgi:exopolyphosphatase/guanosine-5'-triphosphate,3'-diphosphate pyrophosphatase